MTAPSLTIAASSPAGTPVGFGLAGDSQITRSGGSGAGGWQIVDRPWRAATTEWVDVGPWQLTMSLILDGYGTNQQPTSIEAACAVVEGWETPVPGSAPPQPPLLKVSGPVPHTELLWVAQQITWKEAIRDPRSGARVQQNLDVVLWQFLPASIILQAASSQPDPAAAATPAAAVRNSPPPGLNGTNQRILGLVGGPAGTYTVKSGDTLSSIAASLYGSYGYWTLLANANGLRDPNNIQVGQVLTVPAKTAQAPPLKAISISGNNYRNLTG